MEIVFLVALVFLGLSSVLFALFTLRQNQRLYRVAYGFLLMAFLAWSTELVLRYIKVGLLPVYDFKSSLFFLGWCGILGYLVLQIKVRLMVMGAFVAPMALILGVASSSLGTTEAHLNPHFRSIWFNAHVITMFLGLGLFLTTFLSSLLYLWMDKALKTKKFRATISKLPSLASLDQVTQYALTYGFILYSLGMVTGSIYSQVTFGRYWQWDPKEVWALVTWLLYAILLHERLALGWRGKKSAILSLGCFLVLLFTYLVVSHMAEGYHSFKSLGGGN